MLAPRYGAAAQGSAEPGARYRFMRSAPAWLLGVQASAMPGTCTVRWESVTLRALSSATAYARLKAGAPHRNCDRSDASLEDNGRST